MQHRFSKLHSEMRRACLEACAALFSSGPLLGQFTPEAALSSTTNSTPISAGSGSVRGDLRAKGWLQWAILAEAQHIRMMKRK